MYAVAAMLVGLTLLPFGRAVAQDIAEAAVMAPPPAEVSELTLEMLIQQGGPILWVIIGLGFIGLVLGIYLALTLTPRREAPLKLARRVTNLVRSGDIPGATMLCENRDELLPRVLLAGLKMAGQERYIIQEAMEGEGQRGAAEMWQRISYLNNIGVLAPLLGLLGTVWGMIGAFNAIAMDNSQVKDIAMAYNVSMAMITTAGGLLLAIPALVVYYFLRGRVVRVIAHVETQAAEFVELLVRNRQQ
jgi:biopolymer transport protein ExbB